MERNTPPPDDTRQQVTCPHCGHQQMVDAFADAQCEQCGTPLRPSAFAPQSLGSTRPDQADPTTVAPPIVSGGIGRPTEGTQVPHRVPTPEPGKPMAPIGEGDTGADEIESGVDE